jgi:ribosomal protein S24E
MNRKWTEHEKNYVYQNASTMTDKEIAAFLTKTCGRTVTLNAVRKIRQKMGIKKASGRGYCKIKPKQNEKFVKISEINLQEKKPCKVKAPKMGDLMTIKGTNFIKRV